MLTDAANAWSLAYAAMAEEWDLLVVAAGQVRVAQWEEHFARIAKEEIHLRDSGRWLTGRTDWLGVLDRERHEMTHSRLLGWLCDPAGQHGMGTTFLTRFLAFADSPHPPDAQATVSFEVLGPSGETRADVVIELPTGAVVIENKVDAPESPDQCLKLSFDHPEPAHLVLLSPYLSTPLTAGDSVGRWRTMRWRDIRRLLTECVACATGPAAHIAREYEATLRRLFG